MRYVSAPPDATAVIAGVYDTNVNHGRDIFQSLTLANGTNVPVVLTADLERLFPGPRADDDLRG